MLGFGILAAGAVLLWASFTGKAEQVLAALKTDLTQFNPNVGLDLLGKGGSGGGSSSSQSSGGTKPFTVNLDGGGSVTVSASDPAAAVENVKVETGQTGRVAA